MWLAVKSHAGGVKSYMAGREELRRAQAPYHPQKTSSLSMAWPRMTPCGSRCRTLTVTVTLTLRRLSPACGLGSGRALARVRGSAMNYE